jgi:iron-sulfur cluster repair protein YtfE (RIC family)
MIRIIPELAARVERSGGIVDVGDDRDAGASVKTEVQEQHRQLDALLEEVRKAFREGSAREAVRAAFSHLREALETHFEQEERLYYPPIWALRPTQKAPLQACVAAHTGFRSALRDISHLLESDQVTGALETFETFARGFEHHEAVEEAILVELDREVADTSRAAPVGRARS